MPNIGVVLKQEIARLARREVRTQSQGIKKASTQYRRQIAALKRQVSDLEQKLGLLQRRVPAQQSSVVAPAAMQRLRFDAKWLNARRTRLGLSAAEYGTLLGVSPQSIYNWEHGIARPRPDQIRKISALHRLGKREAHERLDQLGGSKAKRRKAASD